MKKSLLVAASLFATASALSLGEAVKAGSPYDGDDAPSPQFVLNQVTAGNLVFQGVGTAQYNNSIGTNNSFQVGSSTNLGVNASTSSTPEYGVQSHAKLDLSGQTTLKQVIGTSGSSHQTSAEQIAAMTYAHDTAETSASAAADTAVESIDTSTHVASATTAADSAQSTWESSNSGTWADYQTANTTDGTFDSSATYQSEDEWNSAHSSSWQNAYDTSYDDSYETEYQSVWQTAYDSNYSTTYSSTYTDSVSAIQSVTDASATDGTIKGSFTTKEFGSASSASTMSDWETEAEDAGTAAANSSSTGSSWTEYEAANTTDGTFDTSAQYQTESEWQDAWSSSYSTAYNNAYSSIASGASRTSDSQVEVKGIGSDATVVSAATSTFDVDIQTTLSSSEAESTATASGSAGANLSTSSFANQSQATTASAFMQAFGGILENTVNPVVEESE